MIASNLNNLGACVLDRVAGFGHFVIFGTNTIRAIFSRVPLWMRFRLLAPQLFSVGTRSIPVVMIVGGFIGMVLAVEAYDQFAMMGLQERLGGVIDASVVRQIGPVLAAVMIAGRVGGAVSAEIGTMRVTEQIDAMRAMGTNPIVNLVVPRVIACVVMLPVLTVFSDLMGIVGGQFVVVFGYGIDQQAYRQFSAQFIESFDVIVGLIKSVFFGLAIGLISCYQGYFCRSGAAGVGRAATDAFVMSFLAIIVMNLFLAKFFKDFYAYFWGRDFMGLTG